MLVRLGGRGRMQLFDAFFVLDFESTCLPGGARIQPQEIIEFPCLKVNAKTLAVESQFHRYVRPQHNPELSLFCTQLTGITQCMVNDELDFAGVLPLFLTWLQEATRDAPRFAFVTSGDWDLKTQLPEQCALSGLPVPPSMTRWINVKQSYRRTQGHFPRSLSTMLTGLNMTFEGRPHCGLDDCRNIARILKGLVSRGHVFSITSSLY